MTTALTSLDFSDLPAVDGHCHAFLPSTADLGVGEWERLITFAGTVLGSVQSQFLDESALGELDLHVETTLLAPWARRRFAAWLGCADDSQAIATARRARVAGDSRSYVGALLGDARVETLFVDEGYPQPTVTAAELSQICPVPIKRVARIEPWIKELAQGAEGWASLERGLQERLAAAAQDPNCVAIKSVIAYRTGLDVDPAVDRGSAQRSFDLWRQDDLRESREHSKPMRDYLLARTLEFCVENGIFFHVHTGGGDPDIVFEQARPGGLFRLLTQPRLRSARVTLIHSGYPWTEEAAYMAAVLPYVYLDLSVAFPWASVGTDARLITVLETAPYAKVLYGSDEASLPEVLWLSAHMARETMSRVFTRLLEVGFMTVPQAREAAAMILAGNARRLYKLEAV